MSLLGTTIGRFRIVDRAGEGGMGEVFVGYDERLQRRVAVKRLHALGELSEGARDRFIREARVLSKLEHPHICQIYDLVEGEDGDFLVLELVEGETLRRILARDEPDLRTRLKLAEQVADVLVAAHAAGIVHRDLKPGNVMVAPGDRVKVLDFGLARPVEGSSLHGEPPTVVGDHGVRTGESSYTVAGSILGTPRFMSPEQARGEPATPASDVYSFGILLQELFTGEPAYGRDLRGDRLLERVKAGDSDPCDGLGRPLTRLMEAMKAAEPSSRPTAQEVRDRLRWIRGAPRRRLRRLVAAAAVVALLGAAGKYTTDLRRERSAALESRNAAVEARQQAEELVGFLIDDLFRDLEPLERLDLVEPVAREALRYYESVPSVDSEDAVSRRATAYRQVGKVLHAQGDLEAARASYRRALALHEGLLDAEPDSPRWLEQVAEDRSLLAGNLALEGRREEALEQLNASRELILRLLEREPGRLEWQARLAYSHYEIGNTLEDLARAEAEFRKALALQERIVSREPEDLESRHRLAVFYAWLGQNLMSQDRIDEAARAYDQALSARRQLVSAAPDRYHWRFGLTWDLLRDGDVRARRGEIDEASASYGEALENQRRVVEHDPSNVYWQRALASTHLSVAEIRETRGDLEGAAGSVREALGIFESLAVRDPASALWPVDLGSTWLQLGSLQAEQGRTDLARRSWGQALDAFDRVDDDAYSDGLAGRVEALLRLDRANEARPLVAELVDRGYRDPDLWELCRRHGIEPEEPTAGTEASG